MDSEQERELTLADIARLAGVGLGTASRALRGLPNVSPATRQKVLEVAERHDYVVSPDASQLKKGATGRVAVVVPHLSRWFFGEMVEGIESVLRQAGYDLLLYHVGNLQDRQSFFELLPARRKVDAVIVVGFPVEEAERQRLELMLGAQIVAAGGQHEVYPHVCIDDLKAGSQAMGHLLALGHRRIAMIEAIDPEQPRQPSGRSAAYHMALNDADIESDPALVVTTAWGIEQGSTAMAHLLSLAELPTAVYAHSDEVAFGAMRTIRDAGLRIPEDISIIGIDDHPHAALLHLTTIKQDVRRQGVLTAQMLLGLLRHDEIERSITLGTHLIVRRTTASPRNG
ncbi:LacI family DNA-binding transcriptional regulator [Nocardioides sp. NPDC127503]|uniref:LacI family DNA-binding transcriptional regulator n=1 Tax=Nocardioides sp. NPDC127503 TaxID=3154516 RepID=UPI00332806F6